MSFSEFQKNVVQRIRELNVIYADSDEFPMLVFCEDRKDDFCTFNLEVMFEDEDFDHTEFYRNLMFSRFVAYTESIDNPEQSYIKIVFLSRTDQDKMLLAYSITEQGLRVLDKMCWRNYRKV